MAEKRLIENQPKFGNLSQYNFDDNEIDFSYENSNGLPVNNDKFQNKDLYTLAEGSETNNAIIERNLQSQAESSIKLDKIYIENVVSTDLENIDIRGYLFSYKTYDALNRDYNSIDSALGNEAKNSRFFKYTRNSLSKNQDIGNLQDVEGKTIISNLGSTTPTIGEDFPGQNGYNDDDGYDYNNLDIYETDNIDDMLTRYIEQFTFNPLFIVIYMKGDSDRWYGTDERKKRFQVFKISNLDLFQQNDDGTYTGIVSPLQDISNYNVTGDEDDNSSLDFDHSAAFKVRDLQITISTLDSGQNNFDDLDSYKQYLDSVAPKISFDINLQNELNFLSISPYNQLNNNSFSGTDYSETGNNMFPKYFPKSDIGFYDSNTSDLTDNYTDLQSFYENNPILSLQTSAPATIGVKFTFTDIGDDTLQTAIDGDYFYFVVDWDDRDDDLKNLDDWLDSRPNNLIDLKELQEEDLYVVSRAIQGSEVLSTIEDEFENPNPYELFPDALGFEQEGGLPPFMYSDFETAGRACLEMGYSGLGTFETDVSDPLPGLVIYGDGFWQTIMGTSLPYMSKLTCYKETLAPSVQLEGEVLNHTYTTPGIKTIKTIVFSYNEPTNQVGRWYLVKSRFYLDIPINQYPDFSEVGGSDYTTLPWPYTTPIIGGTDLDSKYKKSVQDTLSGGKIGDTDLIDEKLLINDIENDETGQSIKEMDFEQVRYFNKDYDIYSLLNITPIAQLEGDDSYLDPDYLTNELPFPQYFEEFDVTKNGELNENDVSVWNTEYYRPDIADYVSNVLSDIEEWEDLPEQTFVGTVRLQTSYDFDTINQVQYWNGELGTCTSQDNNNPNGEWAALYPNNANDTLDSVASDLGYSPLTFDAIDAGDVYFPEFCQNRSCIAERHVDCDSGWNGGTNDSYNIFLPRGDKPGPATYLESVELSVNLLSNDNFDLDDYNVINWAEGDAFAKSDVITGWTAVNNNAVPGNLMVLNPADGGSLLLYSDVSDNLYIASDSNTIISGKTYLVNIDVAYGENDNQPILEVGGGTNQVPLENGMNQFNWTPVFDAIGKVVVRRGGGSFPSSFELKSISVQERYSEPGVPVFAGQIKLERTDYPPAGATPYTAMDTYPDMCYNDDGNGFGNYQLWWQMGLNSTEEAGDPNLVCNALFPNTTATILNPDEEGNHPCTTIMSTFEIPVFDCINTLSNYEPNFEQYINSEFIESTIGDFYQYSNNYFYDGNENKFPEESSVGQIFITDNQDKELKHDCKLELNAGELTGKTIYDSSGNSNKGLLIGDYKVKKARKGEDMRRDSFIKLPKKTGNKDGAL